MNVTHTAYRLHDTSQEPGRAGSRRSVRPFKGTAGFTLVELLVVMAIIILISGFIVTAISGGDGSQALNSGISKANGIFSVARSAAVQRNQPVRVLVHLDSADEERFLRFMIVVYQDDDGNWQPLTQGDFLPNGVFFAPALSYRDGHGDVGLRIWRVSVNLNNYSVNPISPEPVPPSAYSMDQGYIDPLNHAAAGLDRWYVYEFNPNGTAAVPMQRFVLANGVRSMDPLQLRIPQINLIRGFMLYRGGKAVHFQDPTQIL